MKKIPTLPKKQFLDILKQRENEDLGVIEAIEKIFLKKRGYVFKMPKAGSAVILLLTGGLDSVVLWHILMDMYKLTVYPLYVAGRRDPIHALDPQLRSIRYYTKLFEKKFPKYFKKPYILNHGWGSIHLIKKTNSFALKNPEFLLDHANVMGEITTETSGLMADVAFLAVDYSQLLAAQKNIQVETIFCAVAPSDGIVVKNQSMTSMRATMLDICSATNNFSLQFTTPFFEKSLGLFIEKSDLIALTKKLHLPVHKTWSCYDSRTLHCGECLGCRGRKHYFKIAKKRDKTLYKKDIIEKYFPVKRVQSKLASLYKKST
jgi:7-cyano-7-deazaguanine synthase in queuosine biosynthesis